MAIPSFDAQHPVPENGHGLTEIAQRFCLFVYQIEITNKQNMQKSKYFDDPFFFLQIYQIYVTHFSPKR